jgi:hypothetical protein
MRTLPLLAWTAALLLPAGPAGATTCYVLADEGSAEPSVLSVDPDSGATMVVSTFAEVDIFGVSGLAVAEDTAYACVDNQVTALSLLTGSADVVGTACAGLGPASYGALVAEASDGKVGWYAAPGDANGGGTTLGTLVQADRFALHDGRAYATWHVASVIDVYDVDSWEVVDAIPVESEDAWTWGLDVTADTLWLLGDRGAADGTTSLAGYDLATGDLISVAVLDVYAPYMLRGLSCDDE